MNEKNNLVGVLKKIKNNFILFKKTIKNYRNHFKKVELEEKLDKDQYNLFFTFFKKISI